MSRSALGCSYGPAPASGATPVSPSPSPQPAAPSLCSQPTPRSRSTPSLPMWTCSFILSEGSRRDANLLPPPLRQPSSPGACSLSRHPPSFPLPLPLVSIPPPPSRQLSRRLCSWWTAAVQPGTPTWPTAAIPRSSSPRCPSTSAAASSSSSFKVSSQRSVHGRRQELAHLSLLALLRRHPHHRRDLPVSRLPLLLLLCPQPSRAVELLALGRSLPPHRVLCLVPLL